MWRRQGKRKDDDHRSDEISDARAPPHKKSFRKQSDGADLDDDSDDVFICEISKNRKVSVRNWQGKIVVDIREFYIKDGKQMPGKKGISLSLDQWKTLRDHAEEIDTAVAENS